MKPRRPRNPHANLTSLLTPSPTILPAHYDTNLPRKTIFHHLLIAPTTSAQTNLLTLRLCSRGLCTAATSPFLFNTLYLPFALNTFTVPTISALQRIGHLCSRLVVTIPHTRQTRIHLLPRPRGGRMKLSHAEGVAPRLYGLFPLPPDGYFDQNSVFTLEAHSTTRHRVRPEHPELWDKALRTWGVIFRQLPSLEFLEVHAPGCAQTGGMLLERTVVDEALISLRNTLEERGKSVAELVFSAHGGGLWVWNQMQGWDGCGVRGGWWAGLRRLSVFVTGVSRCGAWERVGMEKAWVGMLADVAVRLEALVLGVEPAGCGVRCPLLLMEEDTPGLTFPRLLELRLYGFRMRWGGEEGLRGWLNRNAQAVVTMNLAVEMVEGDAAWNGGEGVFKEWELESTERLETPDAPLVLNRKAAWWRADGGVVVPVGLGGMMGEGRRSGDDDDGVLGGLEAARDEMERLDRLVPR